MKYVEILEQIQKEGSQPLPVFMPFRDTKQGYQSSGYVTIPNTLPFDYLDGKNLKCFCSNGTNNRQQGAKWCHGHILLSCADYLYHKK